MTRSISFLPVAAALGALVILPSHASGQPQTARTRFEDAQARESAIRTTLEAATPEAGVSQAAIDEARSVITAYQSIVRRYPVSGYSDNALFNAAGLAETLLEKFGQARDRDAAVRLYRRVGAEYPTSSLVKQAESAASRLAPAEAANGTAPAAAVSGQPSPSPAPAAAAATAPASARTPAAAGSTPPTSRARLTGIERVVLPDTVRVTLTLDREVTYHEEALAGPARVFFDLRGVEAVPELTDAVLRFPTDLVRQIRVGRHPNSTVRVVLDMEGATRHSTYTLYNPFRLVIDSDTAATAAARSGPATAEVKPVEAKAVAAKTPEPKAPEVAPAEPKPFAPSKATETKAIEAKGRTVQPRSLLTESLPVLIIEPPAGAVVAETKSAAPLPTAPAPPPPAPAATASPSASAAAKPSTPLQAKSSTLPPSTPATPAPEAPNANTAGGFSIARQLGLGVSRIVIDPGHGGHDPGAQGKGLNESELTLDIALRLEEMLKKEPGVEVVLTRRTDEYIPLEERTAIANRESADLFLSIHANASRNAVARGVETYFLSFAATPEAEAVAARENSAHAGEMHTLPDIIKAIALNNKLDESRDLAGMVQEAMVTRLRRSNRELRNLGVKKAPFVVLIGAGMPSVLAEVSFVTNKQELQLLKTPAYKDRIAEALHAAIMRYRRSLKGASAIAAQ
jgi:N-acetylmuramoyl-L-alanine amidase